MPDRLPSESPRLPNEAAVRALRRQLHGGILEPFTLGMEEADGDATTSPPEDDEGMWLGLYDAGREIARAALGLDMPEPQVITRFSKLDGAPRLTTLSVQDLMDENAGFEDSAWIYLQEMIESGYYDDSDWSSQVFVYYMPTNAAALLDEVIGWYLRHLTTLVADLARDRMELTDPREWKVGG